MKKFTNKFYNINDEEINILKSNKSGLKYIKIFDRYINYEIITENIRYFIILFLFILILYFENTDHSRIITMTKSKKYFHICFKDILINKYNNFTINQYTYPIISIIIPLYNCQRSIKPVIRSIQNQNIYNYEILLINDYSNDNTLSIIEELSKTDLRIKIINNNRNMGTLYSRCIGALESKGKYIFTIDNDDLFMNENVFNVVLEEAESEDYDIVEFNAIRGFSYRPHISEMIDDIYHDNPNNQIVKQPQLGIHSITKNGKYEINNIHIWGKCIKSSIYKKAVNALGKKRFSYYMSWAEDTSIVFILFNIAGSFKYISKYGVFHLMSKITACYTESDNNKMFGELFLLDIMFDFSKNNYETKKYIVLKTLEIRNIHFFNKTIQNIRNYNYLKNILKKIFDCKYIYLNDKNKIKKNFKDYNLF